MGAPPESDTLNKYIHVKTLVATVCSDGTEIARPKNLILNRNIRMKTQITTTCSDGTSVAQIKNLTPSKSIHVKTPITTICRCGIRVAQLKNLTPNKKLKTGKNIMNKFNEVSKKLGAVRGAPKTKLAQKILFTILIILVIGGEYLTDVFLTHFGL